MQTLYPIISQYLTAHPQVPEETDGLHPALHLSDKYDIPYLFQCILHLYQKKDANRNIVWHINPGYPQVLIRDARNQTEPQQKDEGQYNYTIIAYSYLMAFLKLAKLDKLDIHDVDVQKICCDLEKIPSYTVPAIKVALTTLIESINEYTVKAKLKKIKQSDDPAEQNITEKTVLDLLALSKKQLETIKPWLSLEDKPLTIITLHAFYGLNIVQIKKPLVSLTEEQKQELHACGNVLLPKPEWYTNLDDLQKELLQSYKFALIEGRLISSFMRGYLPFNKNAYLSETTCVRTIESTGALEFNTLTRYYHCGTLALLGASSDEEQRRITAMNAAQQIAWRTNAEDLPHQVVMTTLNSATADTYLKSISFFKNIATKIITNKREEKHLGEDEQIVALTKNTANQVTRFHASNVCLNGFRCIEWMDTTGIKALLENVKKIFAVICSPTSNKKLNAKAFVTYENFIKLIQRDQLNPYLGEYIYTLYKKMYYCHTLIKGEPIIKVDGDKLVLGLTVVRLACEISHLTNTILVEQAKKYDFAAYGVTTFDVFFGCASGNNRTGYQEYFNDYMAIRNWLKFNSICMPDHILQETLAFGYHMQFSQGLMGLGLDGLRSKSSGTAPYDFSDKTLEALHTDWSDLKTMANVDLVGMSKLTLQELRRTYAQRVAQHSSTEDAFRSSITPGHSSSSD